MHKGLKIKQKNIQQNQSNINIATTENNKKYLPKKSLRSNTEKTFYEILKKQLGEPFIIDSAVRLADLIQEIPNKDKDKFKIFCRHIDFLISDRQTHKILCAIELDDKSHNNKHEEDNFKNQFFEKAHIKLYRFKVKKDYNPVEIKQLLNDLTQK